MAAAPTEQQRYHALDALRAGMMLSVVVVHAMMAHLALIRTAGVWRFRDEQTSLVFDVLFVFIDSFGIPIFLLMAAFFGAMLCERRGSRRLVVNRVQRLLLPLVVAWLVLYPIAMAGFVFARQGGDLAALSAAWSHVRSPELFERPYLMHLWFVYDLLILYALALGVRAVVLRVVPAGVRARALDGFAWLVRAPWGLAVFAGLTFVTLLRSYSGMLVSYTSFTPPPEAFMMYGPFFAFGWLLYARRDLLATLRARAWVYAGVGAALFPIHCGLALTNAAAPDPLLRLLTAGTGGVVIWGFTFGLTGLSLRLFDRPNPWVRYATDASYWIYLSHLPFTIWIPGLLGPVAWPAVLKFWIVLTLTLAATVVTYHYGVRATVVGEVLSGRRYPRVWPQREGVPVA